MCGIVGALNYGGGGFAVTAPYLARMRDTMAHRGPDGAGLWVGEDGSIGLGHRRLAIIDLSESAAQPMSNPDATLWLTFNGEIYNHAEIRRELIELGHTGWKTDHSDTEVLLRAFQQWGIDCVHRLRGMFAFAIWDVNRKELWLARDRIGVKPLYYSRHHNRLVFASEIKAILADPEQPRELNEEGLFHYLTYVTTPAPQTLFAGIQKLPPATWLKIDQHGHQVSHRYWDVWDHTEPLTGHSDEEIAERLLDGLREAVQLRTEGDVPVGVFLSGGIDSSTNAALFSDVTRGTGAQVKTFCVGYEGKFERHQNECEHARRMASEVGAEHHEVLLTQEDLINFLPQMIHLQDEPIGDPVCVPVYYVSKLARDNGVTVCQVGEGADELFWGYDSWKRSLGFQTWCNRARATNGLQRALLQGWKGAGGSTGHRYELLERNANGLPIFWGSSNAFPHHDKMRILSPAMRQRFAGRSSWEPLTELHERFREAAWEQSPLNWMSYVDLNVRLPELLLMRVDKMSMGVSLEGRVPFLDHKFVELAMSIPQAVKTRNGTLKHILKKAVRGVIPDSIIDRPKQGFSVPVHDWLLNDLGDLARTKLDNFCNATGLFDRAEVRRLQETKDRQRLWFLLNVALWWEHHFDQAGQRGELNRQAA